MDNIAHLSIQIISKYDLRFMYDIEKQLSLFALLESTSSSYPTAEWIAKYRTKWNTVL